MEKMKSLKEMQEYIDDALKNEKNFDGVKIKPGAYWMRSKNPDYPKIHLGEVSVSNVIYFFGVESSAPLEEYEILSECVEYKSSYVYMYAKFYKDGYVQGSLASVQSFIEFGKAILKVEEEALGDA